MLLLITDSCNPTACSVSYRSACSVKCCACKEVWPDLPWKVKIYSLPNLVHLFWDLHHDISYQQFLTFNQRDKLSWEILALKRILHSGKRNTSSFAENTANAELCTSWRSISIICICMTLHFLYQKFTLKLLNTVSRFQIHPSFFQNPFLAQHTAVTQQECLLMDWW